MPGWIVISIFTELFITSTGRNSIGWALTSREVDRTGILSSPALSTWPNSVPCYRYLPNCVCTFRYFTKKNLLKICNITANNAVGGTRTIYKETDPGLGLVSILKILPVCIVENTGTYHINDNMMAFMVKRYFYHVYNGFLTSTGTVKSCTNCL
jgi:hypothetical protein